ncbi:MAG: hypothetical protein A2136_05935 [Chloroflexi bacterium RBG_16_54_11]|nr:MAG: hypothetical protein A2136_05935 [Chloroflexi bacterium RBG_16_54_11]
MDNTPGSLEEMWSDLLSSQPDQIHDAFRSLDRRRQKNVLAHLRRMATDPGWQPEQRESALVALQTLENLPGQGE